jgi:ribosomal protein S12 methylthiotransferase accessory factor
MFVEMDVTFPGKMRVDAQYNGFNIKTDQAVDRGGDASAPEPFAMFLASLATCTGLYVLSFCQARDIPTHGLGMRLITEPGPEGKGASKIHMDVVLPQGFPEKYEKAVLRVAEMCTVKKTIVNPPEMTMAAVRSD